LEQAFGSKEKDLLRGIPVQIRKKADLAPNSAPESRGKMEFSSNS
jgi:hypothetical protein